MAAKQVLSGASLEWQGRRGLSQPEGIWVPKFSYGAQASERSLENARWTPEIALDDPVQFRG